MKITLKKPIVLTGKGAGDQPTTETITDLVFRDEVVSGDLRGIKASSLADPPVEDLLKIAGRLCGQPELVMNRLGMDDLGTVGLLVLDFLRAGETGASGTTPSP